MTLREHRCTIAALCAATGVACAAPDAANDDCSESLPAAVQLGPPVGLGGCELGPANPSRLLLTTTDFSTGSMAVVDVQTRTVTTDAAATTTDAIPFWHSDRAILVNRFRYDYLQVLDPDNGWANRGEYRLPDECGVDRNAQAVAFDRQERAWVTQLGRPEIAVMDLSAAPQAALLARINLQALETDGNPNASLAVTCGRILWVALERLDPMLARVGPDELIAIDTASQQLIDLDDAPGVQGLRSRGQWLRQLRRDPLDPQGQTLLGLSTGIERFDLGHLHVSWVVEPDAFVAADIGRPLQAQSFAVDETGSFAYLAAYDADYSQVQLYRVGLSGDERGLIESFAQGFDSVERTLELVGSELWYGSTRASAPGLWIFDTTTTPIATIQGPIPTGLAPYSMIAIP